MAVEPLEDRKSSPARGTTASCCPFAWTLELLAGAEIEKLDVHYRLSGDRRPTSSVPVTPSPFWSTLTRVF